MSVLWRQEVKLGFDYRVVLGTYTTRVTVDCGLWTVLLVMTSHGTTVQDCAVTVGGM